MIRVLVFFPMKIASRATPEDLAGHGLSTTVQEERTMVVMLKQDWQIVYFINAMGRRTLINVQSFVLTAKHCFYLFL